MSSVNFDKYERIPNKEVIYRFKNMVDFQDFIEDTIPKLTSNAKTFNETSLNKNMMETKAQDLSKYGTSDVLSIMQRKTSFLFPNELNNFLQQVRSQVIKTDIVDIDQKKQIQFTERDIGIFSFDLASLGLIRIYEYYSPLLKTIVDSDDVRSDLLPNGEYRFYHVKVPFVPRHICKWDDSFGEYYSPILKRPIPKKELEFSADLTAYFPERKEIPQHDVERIQKMDEDGNPMFGSTFKKVFIHTPKINKSIPRIDLIINASYHWGVDARNQMIWNAMPAIAVAEKLNRSNIPFRLIASYPVEFKSNKKIYPFVVLKEDGEPLDINAISIMISDGRQFRYETFKGFITIAQDAGFSDYVDIPSLGFPITNATEIKSRYMEYLETRPNQNDIESSKNPASKIFFNNVLTERDAINEYDRVIDLISQI
jgi:hypothetical protein